jgi:hypothetical protein
MLMSKEGESEQVLPDRMEVGRGGLRRLPHSAHLRWADRGRNSVPAEG